jgi:fluoroquinolone transport system ATP-binding protein
MSGEGADCKVIEVRQLTYTYPKQAKPTLKGLNFHVKRVKSSDYLGRRAQAKARRKKF